MILTIAFLSIIIIAILIYIFFGGGGKNKKKQKPPEPTPTKSKSTEDINSDILYEKHRKVKRNELYKDFISVPKLFGIYLCNRKSYSHKRTNKKSV